VERPKTTKNVGQPCVICGQSADAQAAIAALQSQLTQLDRTLADVYAQREGLQKDLAQRTAELEAIETILDIDSGKTTVEKVRDLHHSFKQVWESYQDASNEMFKAQAELERVRAERDHAKKMEAVQKEVADNQTWHVQKLRTLIAALPKVEGQFEVGSGACYYVRALDGKSNPIICGLMTEQAVAYAILALLKHRQGME
jgi:Tfp pilus assembly protein PilN